jgi:hypothetical protein
MTAVRVGGGRYSERGSSECYVPGLARLLSPLLGGSYIDVYLLRFSIVLGCPTMVVTRFGDLVPLRTFVGRWLGRANACNALVWVYVVSRKA